ncbi:type II toxin-antitoxin system mRNA interferase toxin, RelE/StbE family [Candidatus Saccharibacteria bacterium]|jgi:addiction module RelE/StbE family toxin|nr:MAG: type II toxin-antitoxin system mRNA interferase toxin, RelE/StbE family [Candidatus Saccharibacteria bacterium]
MRPVIFHRNFEKHYKQRIKPQQKLSEQFRERYKLFLAGERGKPLDDHALSGSLQGRRAFSITGDVRVIYIEQADKIIFLDIGTHSQVY